MAEWLEIVLRTAVSVIFLFLLTKLLGKRQVSQLSLFEYITGITIGSIVAYVSLDAETNWYLGLVSLIVWVSFSYGIELLQIKSKKLRDFFDTKGRVLIQNGKILEGNLKKERLTTDELMEQLRKQMVFKVADVEFAIMEPSGDINVMLTKENQPLTPKDLGLKPPPEKMPQVIVMDGKIMDEALMKSGYSHSWLDKKLKEIGAAAKDVFLAQVDSSGQLYVDLFDDRKKTVIAPQEKTALLATLEKCGNDLALFGIAAGNKNLQSVYKETARKMEEIIAELKPHLQRQQ